jgi:hypothetical protein
MSHVQNPKQKYGEKVMKNTSQLDRNDTHKVMKPAEEE